MRRKCLDTDSDSAWREAIFYDGWIPYPVSPASGRPMVDIAESGKGLTLEQVERYWRDYPGYPFRIMPR